MFILNHSHLVNYSDTTFITVDAGRSYMTYHMLKSFLSFDLPYKFVVLITKDNKYLDLLDEIKNKNITFVRHYDFQNDPKLLPSVKHMKNIEYLVNNYVFTKYFILCDNDIIFTDMKMLHYYKNFDVCGYYENEPDIYLNVLNYMKNLDIELIPAFEYLNKNVPSVKLIKNYNKFRNIYTADNLNYFARIVPYFVAVKKDVYKKYNDLLFFTGKHRDKYYYIDTFSMFTYNIFKNNLNFFNYDITVDINHIGSGITKNYSEYMEIISSKTNHNKIYN